MRTNAWNDGLLGAGHFSMVFRDDAANAAYNSMPLPMVRPARLNLTGAVPKLRPKIA